MKPDGDGGAPLTGEERGAMMMRFGPNLKTRVGNGADGTGRTGGVLPAMLLVMWRGPGRDSRGSDHVEDSSPGGGCVDGQLPC